MPIINLTSSNIKIQGESLPTSTSNTKLLPAENPIYLRVESPLNTSTSNTFYRILVIGNITTGSFITIDSVTFTSVTTITQANEFLNNKESFCNQFNQHILFKNDWFATSYVDGGNVIIDIKAQRKSAIQKLSITSSSNFFNYYNSIGTGLTQGDDNYQYGIYAEVWEATNKKITDNTNLSFDPNTQKRLTFLERNYSKDNTYLFEISSVAKTLLTDYEPLNFTNSVVRIDNFKSIFFRIGQMYSLTENGYRLRNIEVTTNPVFVWDGNLDLTSTNIEKAEYWKSSYHKLLSNQPATKTINSDWNHEIVSCLWKGFTGLNASKIRLRIIFYYSDGTWEVKYNVFPSLSNEQGLYYANVAYPKVKPFSNTLKTVESYEVGFEYGIGAGTGNPFSYFQKYIVSSDCNNSENVGLIFKNRLGGFDSIILNNDVSFSSDRKINFYTKQISENLSKATFVKATNQIDFEKFIEVKTNNLSKEEYNWLQDLVVSKQVYLVYENDIYSVNVTDTNYNYNTASTDNSLTIKLEFSIPNKI